MALLESEIEFTGSIGNLTAYRMRGCDKIVIRKKGGPSKERIQTDLRFERTREINAEFGGRSAASKRIMTMLYTLKPLADYNIAGPLNACLRPVQVEDPVNERGKRDVKLSRDPGMLLGFSFNKRTMLESVIRSPLQCSISREAFSAEVHIPALIPGINFFPAIRQPMYRLVAVLGIVPDLFFDKDGYKPTHPDHLRLQQADAETPWLPVLERSEAMTLSLKLKTIPPNDDFTLLLGFGIMYGAMRSANFIEQVKHAGSAKIIGVN